MHSAARLEVTLPAWWEMRTNAFFTFLQHGPTSRIA